MISPSNLIYKEKIPLRHNQKDSNRTGTMKSAFSNFKRRFSLADPKASEASHHPNRLHKPDTRAKTEAISINDTSPSPSQKDNQVSDITSLKSIKESEEPIEISTEAEADEVASVSPASPTEATPKEEAVPIPESPPHIFAGLNGGPGNLDSSGKNGEDSEKTAEVKRDISARLEYDRDGNLRIEGATIAQEDFQTLKPVIREKVHHHVVEEIQKVKIRERHITHIRHHVQPITQSVGFRHESNTYRLGALSAEDPTQVVTLDHAQIDDMIRHHLSKFQDSELAEHHCPPTSTVVLPDIEKETTVVHKYEIIQPVIVEPDPQFRFSFRDDRDPISKDIVVGADGAMACKGGVETEILRLTSMVKELKVENHDLRSRLNLETQKVTNIQHEVMEAIRLTEIRL
ncbi:uncharacterized protein MELLADRAFT_92493 [Melampsora larici-populina 98AG31]|uniref:Uncharacterized protein n=1 Tax=Melampsora larici-populina (strain 98AG31 / pathotype 3-4-7) TaxID=747676 RepID=F4R8N5_MELLP|nr:uncharacterized protein MELLADRAFT_92493 [Melampsora larici-populina 98AG31]EGG11084.1 hypothetical protein MELLADRAFT_92493 [Melampsora larici-populina 98AG31]